MQIVIPMSGEGRRFVQAGYAQIKPLIEVDGQPVIEHVIDLFPGEKKFIFICNRQHLQETALGEILKAKVPSGQIIAIDVHKKGPVYAVAQAFNAISDDEEVIVNYCDFAKYWDYADFLQQVRSRQADGALSAYRGFHPHMLADTHYAYIKENAQWLEAIQEKQPFTDNKMAEFASDGTYYFRQGALLKKYFQGLLEQGPDIRGEYYVSQPYNFMAKDNLKIFVYEIAHMLQWGEPQHLQEYQKWSRFFHQLMDWKPSDIPELGQALAVVPMAGEGRRFSERGYTDPKPMIAVSGKPMAVQACSCLPPQSEKVFIYQARHNAAGNLEQTLKAWEPASRFVRLEQSTQGQAETCALGISAADLERPLVIISCDHAMIWDSKWLRVLLADQKTDCVVFTFRGHPSSVAHPQMYGWAKIDGKGAIAQVSVKKPISDDPAQDHALTGAFYFRQAKFFLEAYQALQNKNIRINNEFYVDSCVNELIAQGRFARVFEADHYIGWGTPDDLQTFEYWQSFFHKCAWHRYRLEGDPWMNQEKLKQYEDTFHCHSLLQRSAEHSADSAPV